MANLASKTVAFFVVVVVANVKFTHRTRSESNRHGFIRHPGDGNKTI